MKVESGCMETLFLPIAGFLIALLLVILFYSKKRIKNEETTIYSSMLITNLIFSMLAIIIYVYAKTVGNELIISVIQKIYLLLMLYIVLNIALYNISLLRLSSKVKITIHNFLYLSYTIFSLLTLLTPLNVINEGNVLDGNGLSINILLIDNYI